MSEQWSDWIEWNGGECPLTNGTEYTVRLRGGLPMDIEDKPEELDWRHGESDSDIIAYRYKLTEPSCIAEEDEETGLQEAYERINKPKQEYSAYFKDVRHIDTLDVYRVVSLFDCEKHGHAISHAAKKLLLTGARTGGKDVETEVREAIDSLHRWLEMREEDKKCTAQ